MEQEWEETVNFTFSYVESCSTFAHLANMCLPAKLSVTDKEPLRKQEVSVLIHLFYLFI